MVQAAQSEKSEDCSAAAAPISLFRLGFTILMTFFFGSALVDNLTPSYNYGQRVNFDFNSIVFLVMVIPLGSYLVADAVHSCFHNWGKELRLQNLWSGLTGKFTMTFGLVVPCLSLITLVVMIFMSSGGFSEALRYEPLRLGTIVLAFLSMPVLNGLTWRALVARKEAVPARLYGLLNGVAIGISLIFTAMTLNPLWQFANMVAANFGTVASSAVSELMRSDGGRLVMRLWILIPALGIFSTLATPVCSFISSLLISSSFWSLPTRRLAHAAAIHAAIGTFCALALMFGPEIPVYVTKVGYLKAISSQEDAGRAGIRLLRAFGSEQELLKVCYDAYHWGRMPQMWELVCRAWNLNSGYATDYISLDQARNIYYRVTGTPFNTVAKPQTWDQWWSTARSEQGGTIIGGKIEGLHLQESAIKADIDPDSLIGYMEWTFVFKNDSKQQQEARIHIALPFGGVVSRVTLWINGKPCEAAFDERNLVRQAYQSVVSVRRDPVLVTSAGRDRVMMQCFPVPADGGTMKVRLGITFPLIMETEKEGFVSLPKLVENNFEVANHHQISLSAKSPGNSKLVALKFAADGKGYNAHGTVTNEDMLSDNARISFDRDVERKVAKTFDPKNDRPLVMQQIRHIFMANPAKLIVVVDGSGAMKKHAGELVRVLEKLRPLDTQVLFASDEISSLSDSDDGYVELDRALADLPFAPFIGGPDNSPVLLKALEKAAGEKNTAIIWLHGPQPVLFQSDPVSLVQEFGKYAATAGFFDVEVEAGPNRLLEVLSDPRYRLNSASRLRPFPRHGSLDSDMAWLVRWLTNKQPDLDLVRTRHAADHKIEVPAELVSAETAASRHLVDLCVAEEAEKLFNNADEPSAMALASFYRIVTPLTAAVVLETSQQYANFGLDPERGLRPGQKAPRTASEMTFGFGRAGGEGGIQASPRPTPVPASSTLARTASKPIPTPSPSKFSRKTEVEETIAIAAPDATDRAPAPQAETGERSHTTYIAPTRLDSYTVSQSGSQSAPEAESTPADNMYQMNGDAVNGSIASDSSVRGRISGGGIAGDGPLGGGIASGGSGEAVSQFARKAPFAVSAMQSQNKYSSKNLARDANLFDGGSEQRQALNTAKSLSRIASKARYSATGEQRTLVMIVTAIGWLLKVGLVLIGLRMIGFGGSKRHVTPITIGYVLFLAVMALGVHYLMNVAIAVLQAN